MDSHQVAVASTWWLEFGTSDSNEQLLYPNIRSIINTFRANNSPVHQVITESQLQRNVFQCVQNLFVDSTSIESEYKVGVADCISVDIYIPPSSLVVGFQDDNDLNSNSNTSEIVTSEKGIMVEVNGPSHYIQVGPGRSDKVLNVATLRKQQLLEKMGYLYVDIPYDEWDDLKNDERSKKAYLREKLQIEN